MAHTHDVYDMENHFEINGSSRFIKETSGTKLVVVQGDHKSEVLTFKMPRYIDGHDMTLCNKIRIHYINLDTKTNNKSADVYEVTDLTLCEECEDVLAFTWTIEAPATKYSGTLSFLVKFECTEGENVLYQWNTAKYVSVNVLAGIDNSEEFVEKYSNVLEEWYNELTRGADSIEELNQQALTEIEHAKEDAKENIENKASEKIEEIDDQWKEAQQEVFKNIDMKESETIETIDGEVQKWVAAHPEVVGKEYVTPEMFGAVGDGVTDDTLAIQTCFNSGKSNIYFPKGVYLITSTLFIDSNIIKFDTHQILQGFGATIKAHENFEGTEMLHVSFDEEMANPQKIIVNGLTFEGNNKVNGILFNYVQLFNISNISIKHCNIGLSFCDVYYGNVGNNVELVENIVGVRLYGERGTENNTLRFENVRITGKPNHSVDRIGIQIDSILLGVSFNSITIENVEYGFLGTNTNYPSYATEFSNYTIENCYFEAITKYSLALSYYNIENGIVELNGNTSNMMYTIPHVLVKSIYTSSNSGNIYLGWGMWNFLHNRITHSTIYLANDGNHELFFKSNKFNHVELLGNVMSKTFVEFEDFTFANNYANYENFIFHHEENNCKFIQTPIFYNKLCKVYNIDSVTSRPITFLSHFNGVINKDLLTNKFFTQVVVNGDLKILEVDNKYLIAPVKDIYTPDVAFRKKISLSNGDTINVALNNVVYNLTVKDNKFITNNLVGGGSNEYVLVGSITDYIEMVNDENFVTPNNYSALFFDVNVNRYYSLRAGSYAGTILKCNNTSQKTYGTLENRPQTGVELSTYYSTDEAKYYMYYNNAWNDYTF